MWLASNIGFITFYRPIELRRCINIYHQPLSRNLVLRLCGWDRPPIRAFRWESASLLISGGKKDPASLAPETVNVPFDGVLVVSAMPQKEKGEPVAEGEEKWYFLEGRRK
jgi:hypothetical protein